jgi:hypothetical protein
VRHHDGQAARPAHLGSHDLAQGARITQHHFAAGPSLHDGAAGRQSAGGSAGFGAEIRLARGKIVHLELGTIAANNQA